MTSNPTLLRAAADLIQEADALIIGAGAGMSADSGLGVYRGSGGRYAQGTTKYGLTDLELASAATYETHPDKARENARERHQAHLSAQPHDGYRVLSLWRQHARHGAAVITSNIDGLFARAGFPEPSIYEAHGSSAYSQCLGRCGAQVFPTTDPVIGPAVCDTCGGPARPNTLLFGDQRFRDHRRAAQWDRLSRWFDHIEEHATRVVVLEIGAGTDIPIIRVRTEALAISNQWPLIRINPDPSVARDGIPTVEITDTAAAALTAINNLV